MSLREEAFEKKGETMQPTDLKGKTLKELIAIREQVDQAIEARRAEAKEQLATKYRELAEAEGLSLEEVLGDDAKPAKKRVKAKYANPEKPSQTWSGRGKQPAWVKRALEAGKGLKDLEI